MTDSNLRTLGHKAMFSIHPSNFYHRFSRTRTPTNSSEMIMSHQVVSKNSLAGNFGGPLQLLLFLEPVPTRTMILPLFKMCTSKDKGHLQPVQK